MENKLFKPESILALISNAKLNRDDYDNGYGYLNDRIEFDNCKRVAKWHFARLKGVGIPQELLSKHNFYADCYNPHELHFNAMQYYPLELVRSSMNLMRELHKFKGAKLSSGGGGVKI